MQRSTARILFCAFVLAFCVAGLICPSTVAAADAEPATTSPTTGKLDVSFNITLRTSLPTNLTIGCSVTLNVQGETGNYREVYAVAATRNGNTATCSAWFYYSWLLQHPATDTINLTYEVAVPPEVVTSPTLPYRDSSQSGTITPVPVSGTVTHITVDTTL